jgi:hypothetical protein
VPKKLAKSEEYRCLAAQAAALASASNLAHVREKHETAAAQWTALAATQDARRRIGPAPVIPRHPSEISEDGLCAA